MKKMNHSTKFKNQNNYKKNKVKHIETKNYSRNNENNKVAVKK